MARALSRSVVAPLTAWSEVAFTIPPVGMDALGSRYRASSPRSESFLPGPSEKSVARSRVRTRLVSVSTGRTPSGQSAISMAAPADLSSRVFPPSARNVLPSASW